MRHDIVGEPLAHVLDIIRSKDLLVRPDIMHNILLQSTFDCIVIVGIRKCKVMMSV